MPAEVMNAEDRLHDVGDVLLFHTSDHGVDGGWNGPYRVIQPFIRSEVVEAFRAQWKPSDERGWLKEPQCHEFPDWLVKEGFVSHSLCFDWHIGYGRFEP